MELSSYSYLDVGLKFRLHGKQVEIWTSTVCPNGKLLQKFDGTGMIAVPFSKAIGEKVLSHFKRITGNKIEFKVYVSLDSLENTIKPCNCSCSVRDIINDLQITLINYLLYAEQN